MLDFFVCIRVLALFCKCACMTMNPDDEGGFTKPLLTQPINMCLVPLLECSGASSRWAPQIDTLIDFQRRAWRWADWVVADETERRGEVSLSRPQPLIRLNNENVPEKKSHREAILLNQMKTRRLLLKGRRWAAGVVLLSWWKPLFSPGDEARED